MDGDLNFAIKINACTLIHKKYIIYQLLLALLYIHSA